MLYGEIIAVCSQNHTKHINTLCGQNVESLNVCEITTRRIVTKVSVSLVLAHLRTISHVSTELGQDVTENVSCHLSDRRYSSSKGLHMGRN